MCILTFVEWSNSVTPNGHRVAIYWDSRRMTKGEDWEEGLEAGMMHSLCFLPLLSYGAIAPLASLPNSDSESSAVTHWPHSPGSPIRGCWSPTGHMSPVRGGKSHIRVSAGMETEPIGRRRLNGEEMDEEDCVFKVSPISFFPALRIYFEFMRAFGLTPVPAFKMSFAPNQLVCCRSCLWRGLFWLGPTWLAGRHYRRSTELCCMLSRVNLWLKLAEAESA